MAEQAHKRISAIITAYNCAPYLGEAIESVLAQTRPLDEIVVVDDGSTDRSAEVARSYASYGVRLIQQANQGPSGARNTGIAATSGELVAFLDGDDIWLPDKTARQLAYFEAHPEVALVSGPWQRWDVATGARTMGYRRGAPGKNRTIRREIVFRNVVGNPSMVLVRRDMFEQVGMFNPAMRWGEEWDLWIRMLARADVGFVPESLPVIIYRSHPANLSHERRWAQFDRYFAISRGAIASYKPAWQRPILLAQAWSKIEWDRAQYARKQSFPRRQQVRHALAALVAFPFEQPLQKGALAARALCGETVYGRLRALLS